MLPGATAGPPQSRFRFQRWLGVALRALHLVAVVALGIALFDRNATFDLRGTGIAVLVSGGALWINDIRANPAHLGQWAGLSMFLKLIPVALMALQPDWAVPLFWLVVVWSAVYSHAPASFRNAPVAGPRRPPPVPGAAENSPGAG